MSDNDTRGDVGAAGANRCTRCGAGFTCGMQAGWSQCWCAALPAVVAIPDAASGCYCPDCLEAVLGSGQGGASTSGSWSG